MDKLKHLIFGLSCSLCLPCIVSCSSEDEPFIDNKENEDPNQPHSCELILNVSKSGFDDEPQSRSAAGWENGDKIYLTFTVGAGTSYGDAVYNNGTWTVNYYGSLTEGATTKCTAVYFDNPEFESSSVVKITENTGIYEDANGSYVFSGGTLSVTADLKPKTGRIRFSGTNNDEITVYGISHYTSYDCSNGKFSTSMGALKGTVSSGYTPYIYGYFSDFEQPRLNIITSTSGYTRLLSTSIFKAGESGYMTIPTSDNHNGWQNSVIFKVNGVEFTMIPVTYSDGNFLLAETELTRELYLAIMQDGSYTSDLQRPTLQYYSTYNTFFFNLNVLTELSFRFPTADEWKFAAKGGELSQNYKYSGSNIISNVAWYKGNSENYLHDVKQLQPNELGFYDMSGNVAEYVFKSGSYYYNYGGSYNSAESSCTIASSSYNSSDYYNYGCRIALSNN